MYVQIWSFVSDDLIINEMNLNIIKKLINLQIYNKYELKSCFIIDIDSYMIIQICFIAKSISIKNEK